MREYMREYRKKRPGLSNSRPLAQIMLHAASSRARKSGLPFNIKQSDIVIPEACPVLGISLRRGRGKLHNASPTLDRIVPELGYTTGNVVVISHRANRIKQDATPQELEAVASWYRSMLKPSH